MNGVFRERLYELEVELFDTGVLRREETTKEPALSTFVPPNLEIRLISPSSTPGAMELQRGGPLDGRIRPTGRSASEGDHSSATEIRTCQLNSGHGLRHLEIGNDEHEQREATSS